VDGRTSGPLRFEGRVAKDLNVFNGIGPPELLIVLVIVLVIFGPKRLPGLGRSLGTGMREFRDSITGKGSDRDEDEDDRPSDAADTRRQANAALGRSDEETAPVEGEVVSERTRT
jgi:sec-independent protein translocase protein TatA